jgi:RNA polymerase subunit RPABC4/transcription elongation factor Spt4
MKKVLCPVCKESELLEAGANALSRKDNKTEICSNCGRKEAMEELEKFLKES